jgi:hypothetical protein
VVHEHTPLLEHLFQVPVATGCSAGTSAHSAG